MLASHLNGAAFLVPDVYREWKGSIIGVAVGIQETEKIGKTEFGELIVPGRQVMIFIGFLTVIIPCSLDSIALAAGLLIILLLTAIQLRRRLKNQLC